MAVVVLVILILAPSLAHSKLSVKFCPQSSLFLCWSSESRSLFGGETRVRVHIPVQCPSQWCLLHFGRSSGRSFRFASRVVEGVGGRTGGCPASLSVNPNVAGFLLHNDLDPPLSDLCPSKMAGLFCLGILLNTWLAFKFICGQPLISW